METDRRSPAQRRSRSARRREQVGSAQTVALSTVHAWRGADEQLAKEWQKQQRPATVGGSGSPMLATLRVPRSSSGSPSLHLDHSPTRSRSSGAHPRRGGHSRRGGSKQVSRSSLVQGTNNRSLQILQSADRPGNSPDRNTIMTPAH